MGQTPGVKQTIKLSVFAMGLAAEILRSNSVCASGFAPLTPDSVRPQPMENEPNVPLPNPIEPFDSLPYPSLPESLPNIPGSITVSKFNFVGNTVFSPTELNRAIASFIDRPISFAQLVEAAEKITQLYISHGYITTGAYIPAQSLNSGIVEIQIVEGSLAAIEVNVEGRLQADYVRARLANKIATPLQIDRLQSALQLLQLNPQIESLTAELSSGIEPGTNILSVSVVSADSFKIQANLSNNRNVSVGTFERGVMLEEANLLGIGDSLRLAYENTAGSDRYTWGYQIPINARDATLGFDFRWIKNEIVQSSFESADIDIESRNYDLTWRQPLLQRATPEVSQEFALSLTTARRISLGTIMNVPQALSPGADEDGEIRTSVLSLGQEWLQRNRQEVISARSQFNLGLDVLDATILPEDPDGIFFSWRGQFSYLRSLSQSESPFVPVFWLRSELQLAADPLIPTEQFSLGGASTIRGYRQDALLTDSGFLASAEFRLPLKRFDSLKATLQVAPFVDFGTGWNNDGESTEFNTLMGVGLGLLLQTPESFSARLDWGLPLINPDSQGSSLQEDGVYFQLQYDLF
ncbi:MAG: ShlB/FhaC/HecB family hemolysin secretion/activation protein [Cyanobacteria bacterium J06623_7]